MSYAKAALSTTQNNTPFFRRKVCQRTLLKNTTSFWQKFLRFQRTFYKKSFVSGFGADAPTDNAHTKKHGNAVLFIIYHKQLELRSKPCFKVLFVKSPLKIRKNFPQIHQFVFVKAFEFPKDFSRKVLCVRVWGRRPN